MDHEDATDTAARMIKDADVFVSATRTDDTVESLVSIEDGKFPNDEVEASAVLELTGSIIQTVSDMTVFEKEEIVELAIEIYDDNQEDPEV